MPNVWLVGLPVRPDRAADIRTHVLDTAREGAGDGVGALLPPEGVATVTVCLEAGSDGPALWWYVELATNPPDAWADPTGVIRSGPVFDAEVESCLTDADPLVFGPNGPDGRLAVHATHPERPTGFRTGPDGVAELDGERMPRVLLAEDGPTDAPEVMMVTYALRGGPATWFARGLSRLMDWVDEDSWIERRFDEWTEPVIEDERMWTEAAFYDRGRPDRIRYWMECDGLETVWEGFTESSSTVTRVSELVLGWIIQHPERVLTVEGFETDFETLVHAVSPNR